MPKSALIVIDMLNSYEHADAERLTETVEAAQPAMQRLIRRADDEDVLTKNDNDNFGGGIAYQDSIHIPPVEIPTTGVDQTITQATFTLTATTDRSDCGILNNTAIADSTPGSPVESSDSITVTIAPSPDRVRILAMTPTFDLLKAILGPISGAHPRAA